MINNVFFLVGGKTILFKEKYTKIHQQNTAQSDNSNVKMETRVVNEVSRRCKCRA